MPVDVPPSVAPVVVEAPRLPPLAGGEGGATSDTALIVGQPLVSIGALTQAEHDAICARYGYPPVVWR